MSDNRRRIMMAQGGGGILPAGYKECEYLEGSQKQWINTGLVNYTKNNAHISIKLQKTSAQTSTWQYIIGSKPRNEEDFLLTIGFPNNPISRSRTFRAYGSNGVYANNIPVEYKGEIICEIWVENEKYTIIANDVKTSGGTSEDVLMTRPLYVFCINNLGTATNFFGGRIFWMKLKLGGILNLDLVPCLDNNGRPCMYDTVSKQSFYNQGSGEFGYMTKDGVYVAPI